MFRCHVCGATEAHQALVDEVFMINGKYVLVEGIPAKYLDIYFYTFVSAIPSNTNEEIVVQNMREFLSRYLVSARCGEAIFSRETTERVRRMVHGEAQLCAP